MKSSVKRVARLGVLTALGVVLLLLANAVPAGRMGVMAVASFPVCAALMMYGPGWAAGVFAVTAVLGFLLFPGVTAISYAAFFGYYPIAKSLLERIHSKGISWLLKYLLYPCVFAAYWFAAQALFPGGADVLPWYVLCLLGAAAFGVYDWCYSLIIQLYLNKIARYFS